MDNPVLFASLAAFTIAVYVMADGFDLGVGILFLAAPSDSDRHIMMESVEPVWDGNETWLVMGGTLLWAAFPAAYYVYLPAFYLPVIVMLIALVLRGVAFGYRTHARHSRRVWDCAFAGGSLLAAFTQGVILGGIIGGVQLRDGMFVGGPFDFLSVLGVLCGVGLLGGYALLGAGWLVWKTEGSTQAFARRIGQTALMIAAAVMVAVSAWTALAQPEVAARWFSWPNVALLAPVPVATGWVVLAARQAFQRGREFLAFIYGIVLFLLGFAGLVISLWPYVVPRSVTIWDGAADPASLRFIAFGLVVVLPIVLAYQAHAYWVFRGKVRLHRDQGQS